VDNFLQPFSRFFWDCDLSTLDWQQHHDFIIRRLLEYGDIESVHWLRSQLGDTGLRDWIEAHNARGLNPRQIRYWALILDIQPTLANQWVKEAQNSIWEQRR